MLYSFINFAYGISAILLAVCVIVIANRMDDCTRPILKICLVMLILVAALCPMCKLYGWLNPTITILLIPFNFGTSIWLLVNRSSKVSYPLYEVKI